MEAMISWGLIAAIAVTVLGMIFTPVTRYMAWRKRREQQSVWHD